MYLYVYIYMHKYSLAYKYSGYKCRCINTCSILHRARVLNFVLCVRAKVLLFQIQHNGRKKKFFFSSFFLFFFLMLFCYIIILCLFVVVCAWLLLFLLLSVTILSSFGFCLFGLLRSFFLLFAFS